jgi:hypothetical protein
MEDTEEEFTEEEEERSTEAEWGEYTGEESEFEMEEDIFGDFMTETEWEEDEGESERKVDKVYKFKPSKYNMSGLMPTVYPYSVSQNLLDLYKTPEFVRDMMEDEDEDWEYTIDEPLQWKQPASLAEACVITIAANFPETADAISRVPVDNTHLLFNRLPVDVDLSLMAPIVGKFTLS